MASGSCSMRRNMVWLRGRRRFAMPATGCWAGDGSIPPNPQRLWQREPAFDHRHAVPAKYGPLTDKTAGEIATARGGLEGGESVLAQSLGPIWRDHAMRGARDRRSEEHTSELQSLMRISYAVFCLTKKKKNEEKQH